MPNPKKKPAARRKGRLARRAAAPKFSVVVIAKNEAQTLPRLLASLEDFRARGGEVVVLDTGSTDGTPAVARAAGCKVREAGARFAVRITAAQARAINKKFQVAPDGPIVTAGETIFDYSAARNFAASLASNDMVAMPDCDEFYTTLHVEALNKVLAIPGMNQIKYPFVFGRDPKTGEATIQYSHSKFYNRRELKWHGVIHEVLREVGGAVRREVEVAATIVSLEHAQNAETSRAHYLTGLALDCYRDPKNDRNAHYFGRELAGRDFLHSAIAQLERHAAMGGWDAEANASLCHVGDCYRQLGKPRAAASCYYRAIDLCGTRREPLLKLAELYKSEDKFAQAAAMAFACLAVPQSTYFADHRPLYGHYPSQILYPVLWKLGRQAEAKAHFDACMAADPTNETLLAERHWFYPKA